jgi:hypothetical protein
MRVATFAAILLAAAGCALEEGPLMAPGQDCVECHDGGEARRWTAAGTWTRGARVSVTDANGKTVPMRGNDVGNFYTAESLTPPLTVFVDGVEMVTTALESGGKVKYGGCNLCHVNGQVVLPGPEMTPGRDCLRCHDGWVAPRHTVAGTWKTPGAVVRIVDGGGVAITLEPANAVGNFYDDRPLTFPLREVWVDGEQMEADEVREMRHASCNVCHRPDGEVDD